MKTIKFKTTIKCAGCIATVTPVLNDTVGKDNWQVDTQTPEKILTVQQVDPAIETTIINVLRQAGYSAEKLN